MSITWQNQINFSDEKQATSSIRRFLLVFVCLIIAFQLIGGNLPEKVSPAKTGPQYPDNLGKESVGWNRWTLVEQ
jgi:hypothetical protein